MDADEHSRHRGAQTPSAPPPGAPGGCSTPTPCTRGHGQQSAHGRPRCCGVAGGCAGQSLAPPAGKALRVHALHAVAMPTGIHPTLKDRDLSGKPLWAWRPLALTGAPYLPTGPQTPSSGPTTRHHLESKHAACRQVGQLIAAAEGALKGGGDSHPQWTGVHKCVGRWPVGFTCTHLRHTNTLPTPSYLETQCNAWEQTQGHVHSDRHIHTRHRKQRDV